MEKEIRNDAGEIKKRKYFGERRETKCKMRRKRGNEARKRREEKGKGTGEKRRREGKRAGMEKV
jgi:hypothetical protein